MESVEELLTLLKLVKKSDTKFVGQNYPSSWGRVFGGQILAQSLHAAYQTVSENRIAHSMHGYFILTGDINLPVIYEVDKIRDGNSFTTRRVVAYQNGKAIFNMAASFQKQETGVDHQIVAPNILPPEVLRSDMQQVESLKDKNPNYYKSLKKAHPKMFDFKPVEIMSHIETKNAIPFSHVWFKTKEKMKIDLPIKQQLLAFSSDINLIMTATKPHREKIRDHPIFVASIDHAIWFHRDFEIDDWLLYAMDSPSASSARGFARGSIFSKSGILIASVTQEGLIRIKR
ncbi:MAG: acyl-CoA thioesterase II [Flavobacteriaceae bacterium]|nr:acyl-CoA thioesterase II [Flavobacteriaceae bacterium]